MISFSDRSITYEYYFDVKILDLLRRCIQDTSYSLLQLQKDIYLRILESNNNKEKAYSDAVEIIANVVIPILGVNEGSYIRIKSLLKSYSYKNHPAVNAVLITKYKGFMSEKDFIELHNASLFSYKSIAC